MTEFVREEWQFLSTILLWVMVAVFLGPVALAFIPLTLLALKSRELWADMIMGLLLVLVLSDMNKVVTSMQVFKSVKEVYVVLLAMFLLLERDRFMPFSGVFTIFLPFFLYSVFPLVWSNNLLVGIQKTFSYMLMFLIVPNYLLYNYRRLGWPFFRNLIFLIVTILLMGFIFSRINPSGANVGGRFNGVFGNPNGLGIFCFLSMLLFGVLMGINRELFSWRERLLIYAVIFYFLIISGSRASLFATMVFVLFARFFAYSPFLGFMVLVALFGVVEVVSRNMEVIILALGLEEYFRLRTLEDGSGRYFAWQFAWEQIQSYIVFGGGFANDEYIMRKNYAYLERMGHQGGVHNSYLSMWFNVGAVGLAIYLRSFVLLFIKAGKMVPMALAAMFAILFSIMYESWLVGSLNPWTIVLLMIMTVVSEEEIVNWREVGPDSVKEEALRQAGLAVEGDEEASELDQPRPVPVF